MASINFLYRSSKESANLKVRLLFRHDDNDFVIESNSNVFVTSIYWKQLHHKKKVRDHALLNKQNQIHKDIRALEVYILDRFYKTNPTYVDKQWLIKAVDDYYGRGKDKQSEYLTDIIDQYVEYSRPNVASSTIVKHGVIKNKLLLMEAHYKQRYKVSDVDNSFVSAFISFFQGSNYSINTIKKNFNFIKTYCNYAVTLGIKVTQRLSDLKIKGEETKEIYLHLEELKKIIDCKGLSEKLENVRDWLVIGCFTGQRISDFSRFANEMIITYENQRLLSFKQVKGRKHVVIPLLPEVEQVLERRNGEFPRKISDQRFNDYVKQVCKIVGINKVVHGSRQMNVGTDQQKVFRKVKGEYPKHDLVTSHIGRRSFATNFYGKIPTPLLMSATGHTTEKQFLTYIKKAPIDSALELAKQYQLIYGK